MAKKNSAAQPIGRGKAGSGKRLIYQAGLGKKALKTWRGLSQSYRKAIRATLAGASNRNQAVRANIRANSKRK